MSNHTLIVSGKWLYQKKIESNTTVAFWFLISDADVLLHFEKPDVREMA